MQKNIVKKGLVIAVIFLFIAVSFQPVFADDNIKKTSVPVSDGNVLYVGGSGPGNYSRIQDAINASSDGDTVFVYDDSSPYVENVVVNTSISLIGEEKNSTIIDGGANGNGVNLTSDNTVIIGFTITNCSNGTAVCISSNNSIVSDNIITHNNIGIIPYFDNPFEGDFVGIGNNTIKNNLIISNGLGIGLSGENNTVNGNIISQSEVGLEIVLSLSNNISNNLISENEYGILILTSYDSMIYMNNISQNEKLGVLIFCTSSDKIIQNNFIVNGQNAYFSQPIISRVRTLKKLLDIPIKKSLWNGNFWDRSRLMPYIIPGLISLIRVPSFEPPFNHNILQFDWYPAKEPYDIGV